MCDTVVVSDICVHHHTWVCRHQANTSIIWRFFKTSSLGDRTRFRFATSSGPCGGAGTSSAPCILGRVLDSAFIQARVRLSCSGGLIYTGRHTFRASPTSRSSCRGNLVRSPRKDFFEKNHPNSSFGRGRRPSEPLLKCNAYCLGVLICT